MQRMDVLERLKTAVFSKQTVLAEIYRLHGGQSVFDYVQSWPVCPISETAGSMLGVLRKNLNGLYGETLADGVINQLRVFPLVSTIDHHGILGSPFFLNSNLIFSLRPEAKYLICFATAGVSLNNHTWPGSLLVTNEKDSHLRRFSFFPEKQKMRTVLSAGKLGEDDFHKTIGRIQVGDSIPQEQKSKLVSLVAEISSLAEIKNQPDFSHQACLFSYQLWSKTFPSAPKLVYLSLESLVSDLLIQNLQNSQNIFAKLFSTPDGWRLLEKYFTGLKGAFGPKDAGSFLFWAVDSKGRRLHLRRAGDRLKGENFALQINSADIIASLRNKSIYPTSLVCFLVLLYYQLTCLGGFNQVNWLTGIKNKFVDLLKEMGETDLAEKISRVAANNFAETNLVFAFSGGRLYKPTLLDIYLKEDIHQYEKIQAFSKKITLAKSIDSSLSEIYRVITPADERDKELLSISDAAIAKLSGMEAKIKAALRL